jgi:Raf kinase inhibitor-like YbhB/YbcL family protein
MREHREGTTQHGSVTHWARRGIVLIIVGLLAFTASGTAMALEIQSPAISPGGEIPVKYTCDGPDISPPLRWTDPPVGTKGFALISDDPDAPGGTWVHWVLYGIPPTLRQLSEGLPAKDTVADIGRQGVNDFRRVGYGGPCPPRGPAHRYFFKLYALDVQITLPPRKTKAELLKAIEGHVLGQAELLGRYQRR